MIASGNALPPPAYGTICDIDVQGHQPIKQRARRVPLKHLKKLYELLKGLLKAGLIAFSNSPWASPIVIVLKKNGVDIRLCIDYKMVNAITALMEYAIPLVDDLLTELESYLWFCSLDAASGFWAVMMTQRTREISAFVCALGHFEWLRMPFGLKNAPMIYQRIVDNALWGYVQPRDGWASYAEKAVSTSGSPPADTVPAVSPTTAPPLTPSAAETAAPDSLPSSGEPGGQALTLLAPPSAPRAGAEPASARSPTPVTAESSTEPEDSAVGSTSPPLSSVSSAPTQPTSVSLGLRSGAGDSLSSPPERHRLVRPRRLPPRESPVSSVARCGIYSPLSTPSPSPPRASVPPGFRPDGLLEAGVPPLPESSSAQAKPAASSPVRRSASPPSTSLPAPSSASPAGRRQNSIAELWDFLRRWEAEREAEDRIRTQLTAYALMRRALPTDFALRRDLLRAQSFGDMLDVLRANTAESPSSTKELAELRVQNAKLTRDNQALLRRLESKLASSTRFEHDLATVVRKRDEWKRHATKTSELVASFRNTVCVLELQLRESTRQANRRVDSCQQQVDHLRRMVDQRDKDLKRMSEVLAERDVAYSALQGVASSYFEQVQEAAAVISSGGADRIAVRKPDDR
ncbi:unnamed protein product [Phytophthora fragariaefolia]|uniref:Unnamed protein product n=1 Tax=Phytophthora fragariaefolia TaxID=1490495 RepID=A0A9W6YCC8_9STRA|nr:unnamed protein product [Phytophthora fragariaefolia]